jgi:hypothetical protein
MVISEELNLSFASERLPGMDKKFSSLDYSKLRKNFIGHLKLSVFYQAIER